MTGDFEGDATFGEGEANETLLIGDRVDLFVAKYDSSGELLWAKETVCQTVDPEGCWDSYISGSGIAVDSSGNSYVTGGFEGSFDVEDSTIFGAGEANETTLTSDWRDIFVAKYNSSGELLWVKQDGGSEHDGGNGIAVDGSGDSFVTGRFQGSATFGAGEANETTLESFGGSDIFVASFSDHKLPVGNTTVFGSTTTNAKRRAMPFTMPEGGTIESISIYHNGGSGDMLLGVYDGDSLPQNLLANTPPAPVSASEGWQTIDLSTPVWVEAGATIWLAWVFENNPGIRYQRGKPGRAQSPQRWSGGMPDPFGCSKQANYIYSIFATYTP